MKIIISCIFILINSCLIANESYVTVNRNDTLETEKGFAYGNEDALPKIDKKDSAKESELAIIRDILEKQLKVQTEILAILKDEYNPEPRIIINEKGEECIANSSADCFEMPITAEARRVPVIKDWMQKGDLESSAKYLQWQGKYFNEISRRAYNNVAAINQYGNEVYPVDYNTIGFNNTTGYGTVLKERVQKSVLESHLDEVNFLYFIGENRSLDIYAMDNIVKFLNQFGNKIRLQFIFKTEEAMKDFTVAQQYSSEFSIINQYVSKVAPEEFKNFNIHTTPSLVAINKKKKTALTVLTGRASANRANKMILMYMVNQGIVDKTELNIDKAWKDDVDYGPNHVGKILGKKYLEEIGYKEQK